MSNNSLAVAVVQMSSQDDVQANLASARAAIQEAAEHGARLILLPENFAYVGTDAGKRQAAESLHPLSGPIGTCMAQAAQDCGVFVVAGGMPETSATPARPYNTCAVFDPQGKVVARYHKIHIFDVSLPDGTHVQESASTTAGSEVVVVPVDGWNVGLSICYDLRFPEHFRRLADSFADVIVVPSAFTLATGRDHWRVLCRARAIENQAYLLAAGQWGKHPKGPVSYGKSCAIDPWGDVIAQCSEGTGQCHVTLCRDYLQQVRQTLPALEHRHRELVC